jgi:tetrapyrrole methylase family protein/MazG family protein
LTREAWSILQEVPEVYLRTAQHPLVPYLPQSLKIRSFDSLYESAGGFSEVYEQIITEVLLLAQRPQGVVYAVPGHPFVAEATAPEIARRATELGLSVRVVEGLSFLGPTFSVLGLDPFNQINLVDALALISAHHPAFPPDQAVLIAQLYNTAVANDLKLTLMAVYPDEHLVRLVHAAGTEDQLVEDLPLYKIDRTDHIGLLTCLYVPPLDAGSSYESLQETIAHLRAPDGCPWDREQTHLSLRPYLLEETYEALAALDAGDTDALCEELGDLLIQVVLHTQIATENGDFNMAKVLQYVNNKLVYRHPHVFGDLEIVDSTAVKINWDRLKSQEREAKGQEADSVLLGVAPTLPALAQADAFQERAARLGFDWPDIQGVVEKVHEELAEVETAPDPTSRSTEVGDLLFSVVNLARKYGFDAESVLREANLRFRQRFMLVEDRARQRGRRLDTMELDELERMWQEAKEELSDQTGG